MAENAYDTLGSKPSDGLNRPEGQPETATKGQGALAVEERTGSKLRAMRGNIVMAALFVAAACLIYGLSRRKGPAIASAEQKMVESQVDSALLRLCSAPQAAGAAPASGRTSSLELLKGFYDGISDRQIPLATLQKNPFSFVPPPEPQVTVLPGRQGDRAGQGEPEQKDQSREAAMARLAKLHLQAIQRGKGGAVAIISNNLVSQGQRIEGFTVKRITLKEVILTWRNEEFVLAMP